MELLDIRAIKNRTFLERKICKPVTVSKVFI